MKNKDFWLLLCIYMHMSDLSLTRAPIFYCVSQHVSLSKLVQAYSIHYIRNKARHKRWKSWICLLFHRADLNYCPETPTWASYQIRKIAGCALERFPRHRLQRKPLVSDPGIYHDTYVTRALVHVGIANRLWQEKRFRHSRRMRNPQFCVSGKRPIDRHILVWDDCR